MIVLSVLIAVAIAIIVIAIAVAFRPDRIRDLRKPTGNSAGDGCVDLRFVRVVHAAVSAIGPQPKDSERRRVI